MRGKARLLLSIVILLVLALLAAGIAIVKSDWVAGKVCDLIKREVREKLDLKANIGSCALDLLPPALEVEGLELLAKDGSRLLRIGKGTVELNSLALLTGRVRVDKVRLEEPELHLTVEQGRVTNLPEFKTAADDQSNTLLPERLDIEKGRLDLILGNYSLLQLREVRLSLLQKGERQFRAVAEGEGGNLDLVGGGGNSLALGGFKIKADLDPTGVDLSQGTVDLGGAHVEAHGRVTLGPAGLVPDLAVKVSGPLSLLHVFLSDIPPMKGTALVDATTSAGKKGLEARGTVEAHGFGIFTVHQVEFKTGFSVDTEKLNLPDLEAISPAGTVSGHAQLFFAKNLAFGGTVNLDQADLKEGLALGGVHGAPISTKVRGPVNFKGQFIGKHGAYVILDSHLLLQDFEVKTRPGGPPELTFNSGTLQAQAAFSGRRVRFPSFRLDLGDSHLEGAGKIRFHDGAVTAAIHAPRLVLADLAFHPDLGLEGTVAFALEVGGSFPAPDLRFDVEASALVVRGRTLGSLRGHLAVVSGTLTLDKVVVAPLAGLLWLSGSLGLAAPYPISGSMDLDGVPLDEIVAVAAGARPPLRLAGAVSGRVEASGSLQAPRLDFQVSFLNVWVGGQRFEEGGAQGQYDSGNLRLDLLEARMGTGWLFAQGGISANLDLDLSAYTTGLRAGSFQVLEPVLPVLDFRLDLHLSLKGPLRSPALQGWAKFYDTRLGGRPVQDSFVSAQATTQSFEVQGRFLGGTAILTGQVQLQEGLPFSSELRLSTDHLEQILAGIAPGLDPGAQVHGTLKTSGRLLSVEEIHGTLDLERVRFGAAGLRLENREPVLVGFDKGGFSVRQCRIYGTETSVSVSGGGSISGGPRLTIEGTVGLGVFPMLFSFPQRAAGRATIRLNVAGDWSAPSLAGSAALTAGLLRFSFLGQDLEDVEAMVRISPQLLEVVRASGKTGGGTFSIQGKLNLHGFVPESMVLGFDLDRVRYDVNKSLWGIASGSLVLSGTLGQTLKLSGEVQVSSAEYRENIELVPLDSGLFRWRRAPVRAYDASRETLAFDVRLRIPDNFHTFYNLGLMNFAAELKADLHLTGTNERLGLLGEIEALEGTVDYLGKEFMVSSARVQFTEQYEVRTRLEILASRLETVDRGDQGKTDYQVDLRLVGEGESVRVTLKSDPPLDETDIITLLSLGVTSRDLQTVKSENLVGLGGEIMLRSFKLDERLHQIFPFPPEAIQPKYIRFQSRFSMRMGTTTPRLETGARLRLISDNLDLDYSRSLFDDTDQSVDLTYKLAEGVFPRLRWENIPLTPVGDVGVDLKLHWEF